MAKPKVKGNVRPRKVTPGKSGNVRILPRPAKPSWKDPHSTEAFRRRRQRGSSVVPIRLVEGIFKMGTRRLTQGVVPEYPRVTISVAVRGVPKKLLVRAMQSVLNQTYQNLLVVVTSDGEAQPSWEGCAFVKDPRVVCWKTTERMGPYFAHEMARRATSSPLFAVQDADDWSDTSRIETLVRSLQAHPADAAVSAISQHRHGNRNTISPKPAASKSRDLPHRLDHFWVVRTEAIERIGGYYAGMLMGTDTLLTNLVLDFGTILGVPAVLYHRQEREGSLTKAKETGLGSKQRTIAREKMIGLYGRVETAGLQALAQHFREVQERPVFKKNLQVLCDKLSERSEHPVDIDTVLKNVPFTDWSISSTCARALFQHCVVNQPRCVVDFGSGVSTAVFAAYAARSGAKIISLEHDRKYFETISQVLARLDLFQHVDLRLVPLDTLERFGLRGRGYSFRIETEDKVDFAFIDGPPERVGRLMTLPMLQEHLTPGWQAWMHDGLRATERSVVSAWSKAFGGFVARLSVVEDDRGVYKLKGNG